MGSLFSLGMYTFYPWATFLPLGCILFTTGIYTRYFLILWYILNCYPWDTFLFLKIRYPWGTILPLGCILFTLGLYTFYPWEINFFILCYILFTLGTLFYSWNTYFLPLGCKLFTLGKCTFYPIAREGYLKCIHGVEEGILDILSMLWAVWSKNICFYIYTRCF